MTDNSVISYMQSHLNRFGIRPSAEATSALKNLVATANAYDRYKTNMSPMTSSEVASLVSPSDEFGSVSRKEDPFAYADYIYQLEQDAADQQFENAQTSAAKAMEFEASEAQKVRDWQESMSNTAYQRSVADLKKAGLNPILALGNAASTPSGVSANGYAASSAKANMNSGSNVALALRELAVNSAVKVSTAVFGLIGDMIKGSGKIISL